jgi:hypothetical protein
MPWRGRVCAAARANTGTRMARGRPQSAETEGDSAALGTTKGGNVASGSEAGSFLASLRDVRKLQTRALAVPSVSFRSLASISHLSCLSELMDLGKARKAWDGRNTTSVSETRRKLVLPIASSHIFRPRACKSASFPSVTTSSAGHPAERASPSSWRMMCWARGLRADEFRISILISGNASRITAARQSNHGFTFHLPAIQPDRGAVSAKRSRPR